MGGVRMRITGKVRPLGLGTFSKSQESVWPTLTLVAVIVVTIAAVFWILSHPFGVNWDEARYVNRSYRDVFLFQEKGVLGLVAGLLGEDRTRPPMFRLSVLPLTLVFGASSTLIRLVSLGCWIATFAFVYQAGRRIAGTAAGALAALLLIVSPVAIASGMRFYPDYGVSLAIAAILYFLMLVWNQENPAPRAWIGLGIALGLGALSKISFFFVAGPLMAATVVLSYFKVIRNPSLPLLLRSMGLGFVVALPWWAVNVRRALGHVLSSSGYTRHSLGPKGSVEAITRWLYAFAQSALGPAITIFVIAILVTCLVQGLKRTWRVDRTAATAILVCLAGALPMQLLSMFGTNQNTRLFSATLVPLALAIGILFVTTGWSQRLWGRAIAVAIICFQLAVMVSPSGNSPFYQEGDAASKTVMWGNPTSVMRRSEQWDWQPLRQLCLAENITNPLITYMGNANTFNSPQIALPWVKANEEVRVRWLWNGARGAIDWNTVAGLIDSSDVVVTAQNLVGEKLDRQHIDNQHNAELIQKLEQDTRFRGPFPLAMGRYEPVELTVFLRHSNSPKAIAPDLKTDQLF